MTSSPNFYVLSLSPTFTHKCLVQLYQGLSPLLSPPPNSLPIFWITTHFSIFRKLFLFFTFIILSTMLSLCINLFTFFIFISTKHLYIAIQLKLFVLDNLKSYVTSHLYSGLVMTYSCGRKSKAKPRKHCVFFIYLFCYFTIFSI